MTEVPELSTLEGGAENVRDRISALEASMRPHEQIDMQLTHVFAPGAYARTIVLPKGIVVVGKIHRHAHLNIVSSGHVTVVTEFGRMDIRGPHIFTSKAGTKRALYTHEETVWTTVHLTDKTDLAEIESEIIAKDYSELSQALVEGCFESLESQP